MNAGGPDVKKAFDHIYGEFVDVLFRYFMYRLTDREWAKDLTQETFVRFWKQYYSSTTSETVYNPRALLFTIAHNLLVNHYERKKQTISLDDLIIDEQYDPPDIDAATTIIRNAEGGILQEHIYKLHPAEQELLYLRYYEGIPIKEIATIFGETENHISVKIHRVIAKLRKLYE